MRSGDVIVWQDTPYLLAEIGADDYAYIVTLSPAEQITRRVRLSELTIYLWEKPIDERIATLIASFLPSGYVVYDDPDYHGDVWIIKDRTGEEIYAFGYPVEDCTRIKIRGLGIAWKHTLLKVFYDLRFFILPRIDAEGNYHFEGCL